MLLISTTFQGIKMNNKIKQINILLGVLITVLMINHISLSENPEYTKEITFKNHSIRN